MGLFSHIVVAPGTLLDGGSVATRPHLLGVVRAPAGAFQGKVQLVEPLGKDTLLYFDHGGGRPLIVVVEGTKEFRAGVHLGISFDPDQLYLFGAEGKRIR